MSTEDIFKNKKKVSMIGKDKNPTVYFLFDGDAVVYVGKTFYLEDRLKAHRKENKKQFDSYSSIDCMEEEMHQLESESIFKHAPKYNRLINCKNTTIQSVGMIFDTKGMNRKIQITAAILGGILYIDTSKKGFSLCLYTEGEEE